MKVYLTLLLLGFAAFVFAQKPNLSNRLPLTPDMPEWAKPLYQDDLEVNVFALDAAFEPWAIVFDSLKSEMAKAGDFPDQDLKHQFEHYKQYYKYYTRWRARVSPYLQADGSLDFTILTDKDVEPQLSSAEKSSSSIWSFVGPVVTRWRQNDNAAQPHAPWQVNIYCLDVAPSDPNTVYCGSETGVVNKSTDKGLNWSPVGADFFTNNIGAIAIHPINPDIVYVSELPAKIQTTTDGGATWSTALNIANFNCEDIKIKPDDPEVVLASGSSLQRRTAGNVWTNVLNKKSYDIAFKPDDPSIAYVLVENAGLDLCEFWKSTDGGQTWTIRSSGWITGLTDGGGRLTVTPADNDRIYAVLLTGSGPRVMRSDDAGENWTIIASSNETGLIGPCTPGALSMTNGQGFFDLSIAASHTNEDHIILGTTTSFKSTDGGATYTLLGGYCGPFNIHPDIQEMRANGTDTWIVTDGGVNLSTDFYTDPTIDVNYFVRVNNLRGSEHWGFDAGWNEDVLVGGRYHDGNTAWRETYPAGDFLRMGGGEAPTGYVNPGNPSLLYFSDIGGKILPTTNTQPVGSFTVNKWPNENYYPMEGAEQKWDPRYMYTYYLGNGNQFWKTTDNGLNFTSLFTHASATAEIRYVEVSRSNPDVIYFTVNVTSPANDGELWKTTDGGVTWTQCSNPGTLTASQRRFSKITMSGTDENTIWWCFRTGPNGQKVFKSTDGGSTWVNWTTAALDNMSATDILHQLGTDGGVYFLSGSGSKVLYRDNSASNWTTYNTDLPLNLYGDFGGVFAKPFYKGGKLRLGTGNGIWEADLYTTSTTTLVQPMVDRPTPNCQRDTIQLESYSVINGAATYQWSLSPTPQWISDVNLRNPKVVLGSTAGFYSATLTVTDNNGTTTRTINNLINNLAEGNLCAADTIPGKTLSLDGSGDYAVPNANLNLNSNTVSMTAWVKRNGTQVDFSGIVYARGGTTSSGLSITSANGLRYTWNDAAGSYGFNTGFTIPDNVWTHVALVITATNAKVYMNGVAATRTAAHPAEAFDTPVKIGYDNGSRYFKGQIDEVSVWNKSLTQDEIRDLMHLTQIPANQPNLVSYYQFNEPSGDAMDKVGTRHAALTGNASRVVSTGPFGGGKSSRQSVTTGGLKTFASADVLIGFPVAGTYPNGEIVVNRINLQPDSLPPCSTYHSDNHYWIIDNYGTNQTFTALDSLRLGKFLVPATDAISPLSYKLRSRTTNAHLLPWTDMASTSIGATGGANGRITFGTASAITQFGQFLATNTLAGQIITGPASVCSGGDATLDAGAGYSSYSWSGGGGSGQTAMYTNLTSTSTFTVIVTDANGCTGSAMKTITVNTLPLVTCPGNLTVNIGTPPFALSGENPSGGTYSGPGVSANTFSPILAGSGTHTVTYSYTDGNTCTNICTFIITVSSTTVSINDITLNEGTGGSTTAFNFTVTRNDVSGAFSLTVNTSDGTATVADNDYDAISGGTVSFTAGGNLMETVTVLVNHDNKVEANETFIVLLSGAPAGVNIIDGTGTGTITNDEVDYGDVFNIGAPFFATTLAANGARHNTVLDFHLGAAIDGDPDGQPNFTATGDDTDANGDDEDGVVLPVLVKGATANITVTASAPGLLNAWVDFEANARWDDSGNQVFTNFPLLAGVNNISFAVPVAASSTTGAFARFRFSSAGGLSDAGLAADGEVEDYMTSIIDNLFSIDNPSVAEGNAGTANLVYTVSRSSNVTASSVDYAITGGTATSGSDYQPLASGTINFTAGGALTQTITVAVNGDLVVEDNETVIITLSNPVNGGIGASPGTGTINNDDSATLMLSGGAMQNETNAGTVAHSFTATLSAAVQGGFTIAHTTNNGAAVAPGDFTNNDGTLTFVGTLGETKIITVQANGDITVELDETFTENLGAIGATTAVQAAAITLSGSPQTATIINDDAATVSFAGNVSQAENLTPQVFTVNLSNPTDVAVTVQFSSSNGTATTTDNDYTGIAGQTVTFAANTTTAQTVNVTIINDNKVEADEVYNAAIGTLNASGRNVSLGTSTGTGTITNDDNATVTLSGGIAQNEGNAGTTGYMFTATLNNPVQGGFSANYTTNDGTATLANNDYQDNDGSLSFVGTTGEAQTFTVLVNGDLNIEADETFQTAINSLTGVVNPPSVTIAGSPQTAIITNDEQDWADAPTVAQSGFAGNYPTFLADNGARHGLTPGGLRLGATVDADLDGQPNATATGDGADEDGVTLPSAIVINTTANITVNASGAGNLNAWADYNRDGDWSDAGEQVFSNQSVVAGSNSLSFAVPNASLGNSFMRFRLATAAGASFDGLAADGEVEDYAINIVNTQFSISDPSVTEGNAGTTNLDFVITRTVNANACSVDYAITGGTATTADGDYQILAAGTVNFTAGGAFAETVNVLVNGDLKVELNETVDMTLSNPVNASILDDSGTGTITNDDAATITVNNPTVTEGDTPNTVTATFTINMSNPSDANVSLNYATLDGSATLANNDYLSTSGSHTFSPGQTSKTVAVTVNGDCAIEPNESYLLRLSGLTNNGRNVSLSGGGATLDGTGTINNDDALPVITCPASLTVNVDLGVCTRSVTLPLPTTSSVCGSSSLEFRYRTVNAANTPTGPYNAYAPSSSNTVVFTRGRYEIEWRITDGSGISVCSFFLQVNDTQAPMITCPANQNIPAGPTCAGTVGTWNPVTLSDNCTATGLITVTQTPPSNTVLSGHNDSELVTLTANDGNGNTSSCSFTVTLKDVTAPIAKCKNVTANLGANGTVTVAAAAVNNGSSDNCTFSMMLTPSTFGCSNLGPNIVTLKVADAGGNTATCAAIVTVKDATGPNALCKNPTIFLDNIGQATLSVAQVNNGSTDNCGIATMGISETQFNCSHLPGSSWPVTLSLTDLNGNTSSCLSYVTVKDAIAPTAICENVTVQLNSNGTAVVYGADLAVESTDNCSVWSYSPVAKVYKPINIGNNNLTITVKDWSMNAATCVSVVTVLPFNGPSSNPTGLSEGVDLPDFAFNVYPNPTTGDVYVAFELPAEQPVTIRVFDLQGRMVLSRENLGNSGENTLPLRLEGIPAGVYIVDFQSESLRAQRRLVVQE